MTQVAKIDQDAVLKAVGINARDPNAQALLLVCERYGLDPLLKHMVLIQGRPYVTRDGYLHIAHTSKQLDGIEILDTGESQSHWWATVAVYRKDMGRPFTYTGRYPKSGSNKAYGPEMAVKCAEVAALRRAFNVTGVGAADEKWDDGAPVEQVTNEAAHDTGPLEVEVSPQASDDELRDITSRVSTLTDGPEQVRDAFMGWKQSQEFGWPWTRADVQRMHAELDRLQQDAGGEGDPDGPYHLDKGEHPPPADPAAEAERLASEPCTECGSTRAQKVLGAGGKVVCKDRAGCAKRREELEEPM